MTNKEQSINILDLLKYLIHHWKWFALSILIFGGYFYYQYSKTPFIYNQSEVVMIKTPSNTPTTARITRSSVANAVSVKDEIIQLKSKELMRLVVDRISADKSYKVHSGLRDFELYKNLLFRYVSRENLRKIAILLSLYRLIQDMLFLKDGINLIKKLELL